MRRIRDRDDALSHIASLYEWPEVYPYPELEDASDELVIAVAEAQIEWEEVNGLRPGRWVPDPSLPARYSVAALPPEPEPVPVIVQLSVWAKYRGVPVATARRWAARGELPGAYLSGRAWLLPADVLTPRAQVGAARRAGL